LYKIQKHEKDGETCQSIFVVIECCVVLRTGIKPRKIPFIEPNKHQNGENKQFKQQYQVFHGIIGKVTICTNMERSYQTHSKLLCFGSKVDF
jgi:hypothetical protein